MENRPQVLIVDRSEENRQVLREALERRGVAILEAAAARSGVELAERHEPAVIVLDWETLPAEDSELSDRWRRQSADPHTRLVVLGALRRQASELGAASCLAKPYHFAPLIRTIEALARSRADDAALPRAA